MAVPEIARSQSITMAREELLISGFQRLDVPEVGENPIMSQLGKEVFGQDEAVESVSDSIMRSESGFNDPNRPRGVFLFLGPTGVGKTETAKSMARFLYGSDWENRYKRIDCTDYQEKSKVNRITGSQHGYVGYGDPVLLMPQFLNKGAVILFDEIETADRSLHEWLLPVLEEGVVEVPLPTDRPAVNGGLNAREVVSTKLDFRNSYIVMTSNVGADAIRKAREGHKTIGFKQSEQQTDVRKAGLKALKEHFSHIPEFLGRIGETNTIPFKDLGVSEYQQIFDKFMAEINANQSKNGLMLTTTLEMRNWMIDQTVAGEYGARTLRNIIESNVVDEAAKLKFAKKLTGLLVADVDPDSGKTYFWSPAQNEVTDTQPSQPAIVLVAKSAVLMH